MVNFYMVMQQLCSKTS
ncbi:hypothetical protein MTR67_001717 [Solanum verrucosum]|uniref:Uncharacterized protein n=1 Tax=Solanum verrucosum TaxID=315347 RepID=A0AAF0T593_SOLVR|nr:hypothetical protein MTR67_001717 [Solanum verrucosum]